LIGLILSFVFSHFLPAETEDGINREDAMPAKEKVATRGKKKEEMLGTRRVKFKNGTSDYAFVRAIRASTCFKRTAIKPTRKTERGKEGHSLDGGAMRGNYPCEIRRIGYLRQRILLKIHDDGRGTSATSPLLLSNVRGSFI